MEYGPPLTRDEEALDALSASIATSRGTNGAGLGWNPPEPELLQEAGTVLMEHPERLQDVVNHAQVIERKLYPAWPGRDRDLEEHALDQDRQNKPDVFDRERERHASEVRAWRTAYENRPPARQLQNREPRPERTVNPDQERHTTGIPEAPRPRYAPAEPDAEIPLPAHAPNGNRHAPTLNGRTPQHVR